MGRAEQLLERILLRKEKEIEDMIKNKDMEELFLDYKLVSTNLPSSKLAEDDRKNLAKATSGFGNSEGGIVIWGVKCKFTRDVGDVPEWPPSKVSDVVAFKSLLERDIGGLTLPAHERVQNFGLAYPNSTEGFVVTYIPKALNIPIQTLIPTNKQEFYIRAGSSFLQTPRAVLASMFGKGPQPDFRIAIALSQLPAFSSLSSVTIELQIYCENIGRSTAKEIFFNCSSNYSKEVKMELRTYNSIEEIWEKPSFSNCLNSTLICKPNVLIPPGAQPRLFDIAVSMFAEISTDIRLMISCGSDNAMGSVRDINIPWHVANESYKHLRTKYPNDLSRADGDKHVKNLFAQCLATRVTN